MSKKDLSIPELFPRPKMLEQMEGESDLALDVRLVTANVYPLQRKAIRSILGEAGVRVVANKKKYVVEARVENASAFDLRKVPVTGRKEYYELELHGSEVTIRAPEQDGTVWGIQTAATLFRVFQAGRKLPNLRIVDWPVMAHRGVTLRSCALMDKMELPEWMQCIDLLSSLKFNFFGLELYSNEPSARLNIPVPEADDWCTVKRLDWYSAAKDLSGTDEEPPKLRSTEDLFNNVVTYGEEKGVHLFPVIDVLDGSDYLASQNAAYSAKAKNGSPLGKGVCFSSAEGRKFLAQLLEATIARFFPNGTEVFELRMNGAPKVQCQCKACAKKRPQALFQDYLLWLIEFLLSKGIGKIVLWNAGQIDAAFEKKLVKAGWQDKVLLLWPGKKEQKEMAWKKSLFPAGTVVPGDFRLPSASRLEDILTMAVATEKGKAAGVAMDCVYRPQHLDGEALLATCAWEGTKGNSKPADIVKHWNFCRFGENAAEVTKAQEALAAAESVAACPLDTESGLGENAPGMVLAALEKRKGAAEQLKKVVGNAETATKILTKLRQKDAESADLKVLLSESLCCEVIAGVYAFMLSMRKALSGKPVTKKLLSEAEEMQGTFTAKIQEMESVLPLWLAPFRLHQTGEVHFFLERLLDSMREQLTHKHAPKFNWK